MGVDLVELLGGHPRLQDRKRALGGRPRAGSQEAITAAPYVLPPAQRKSGAELALHLAGGAEFRQPLGDGS